MEPFKYVRGSDAPAPSGKTAVDHRPTQEHRCGVPAGRDPGADEASYSSWNEWRQVTPAKVA